MIVLISCLSSDDFLDCLIIFFIYEMLENGENNRTGVKIPGNIYI